MSFYNAISINENIEPQYKIQENFKELRIGWAIGLPWTHWHRHDSEEEEDGRGKRGEGGSLSTALVCRANWCSFYPARSLSSREDRTTLCYEGGTQRDIHRVYTPQGQ